MAVEPWRIAVEPLVLDDLRDRLRGTRWPDELEGGGWSRGTDRAWLEGFVADWAEFDWPAYEARLNELDHRRVVVDGTGVHVVCRFSRSPSAMPLVLLHGWPSSFLQLLPVLPLLADPDDGSGFHAVALSLPGYGFSDRPTRPGTDVAHIADLVVGVLAELGFPRFLVRASDLGAGVAGQLALRHPERLIGLHLSGTNPFLPSVPDDLSPAEAEFVAAAQQWNRTEMAYALLHSTKPQTLAYGLTDSPVGLAAWVMEKFHTWTDGDPDEVYARDDLLANLTVYWATGTIGSSVRLYHETAHSTAAYGRVEVPTGMAMSGADMFPTPREWAERSYRVVHWTDLPRGGHFLEWEVPELIAGDLHAFARSLTLPEDRP